MKQRIFYTLVYVLLVGLVGVACGSRYQTSHEPRPLPRPSQQSTQQSTQQAPRQCMRWETVYGTVMVPKGGGLMGYRIAQEPTGQRCTQWG